MIYFVHINKTGGGSIRKVIGYTGPHFHAREKIRQIGRAAWNEAFTFSVVRNPFDRAVALWAWRRGMPQHPMHEIAKMPFHEWAPRIFQGEGKFIPWTSKSPMEKGGQFMQQVDWITDEAGDICVDLVLRFEDLRKNWPALPHVNKSKRETGYRQYYNEPAKEAVARYFGRDLETFGYEF